MTTLSIRPQRNNTDFQLIARSFLSQQGLPLANVLPICIATEAGALIMQPKVLKGIEARSEDHAQPEDHRRQLCGEED